MKFYTNNNNNNICVDMNNGYGNKTIKVVTMKFLGLQISCKLS